MDPWTSPRRRLAAGGPDGRAAARLQHHACRGTGPRTAPVRGLRRKPRPRRRQGCLLGRLGARPVPGADRHRVGRARADPQQAPHEDGRRRRAAAADQGRHGRPGQPRPTRAASADQGSRGRPGPPWPTRAAAADQGRHGRPGQPRPTRAASAGEPSLTETQTAAVRVVVESSPATTPDRQGLQLTHRNLVQPKTTPPG